MAFIVNNYERKNCYKKRKHSLMKKTEEISVLCGIEACAIVYSPYDAEPQIWPSKSRIQNVLERFRSFPEWLQIKNKVNQEIFISQRIAKAKEQMKRFMKDNKEDEMTIVMYQCLSARRVEPDLIRTVADLNDLSPVIEQNLKDITQRLNTMKVNEMAPNQSLMLTQSNQPQLQTQSQQSQMQSQFYQPQMPAQPYQSQTQMLAYRLQLQTSTYQAEMQALVPEEMMMPMLNYGHVSDMNANHMQNQGWMDMLNGNGDETTMLQFGDPNLPL